MVETVKSTLVTNFEARPNTMASLRQLGGVLKRATDTVTVGEVTGSNTSTYKCLPLPSHAVIVYGTVVGIGSVDAPNVDVGVIHSDGRFLDDDGIVAALDIDDTGAHDFGALGVFDDTKRLWEYSSATSDPGGIMYLHLSLDADAVVAGNIKVIVEYIVD